MGGGLVAGGLVTGGLVGRGTGIVGAGAVGGAVPTELRPLGGGDVVWEGAVVAT